MSDFFFIDGPNEARYNENKSVAYWMVICLRKKQIVLLCLALLMSLWVSCAGAQMEFCQKSFDPQARYIDLGDTEVTDWEAFFDFLDGFSALEKVDMFATCVDRKDIAKMVERYPDITFGWTIQFAEHTVRTDAIAFSTLHHSGSKTHSAEVLSVLKYCKQLRALDIGHNCVDDISFLYELPELRVLIVACNRITDISPIASLEHLEYLEMFSNFVEDVSPLKELPYLAHLNIGYNNIRDLSPLHEMPQLKRLWMKKCHSRPKADPLSDKVIDALQDALGDCVIDTKHNPSEGGWREGIYYEVFHEYFRTGEYRPFPDSPLENR